MVRGNCGSRLTSRATFGRQHRGHDLPEDHLVDLRPVELGPVEQLARGVPGQGHARRVAEDGAALGEGRAHAGDDGDAPAGPGIDMRMGPR